MDMMILSTETVRYVTRLIENLFIMGGICVALPITVVWLITRYRTKKMERKMDVLMKTVDNGQQVDPALLTSMQEGEGKARLKNNLLNRLASGIFFTLGGVLLIISMIVHYFVREYIDMGVIVIGSVCVSLGAGLLVSYFVGRKFLAKEIEAEENKIDLK